MTACSTSEPQTSTSALLTEARAAIGVEFSELHGDLEQLRGLVNDATAKLGSGFHGLSSQIKAQDQLIRAMTTQAAGEGGSADGFRAFAAETGDVLAQLCERIERTGVNSIGMARQIDDVSVHINEVSTLVKGVKQIAAHTKLVALNAMIEAAHAGDVGLGFAVVATEVKSLSQRSDTFSDQIVGAVDLARKNAADVRSAMSGIAQDDQQFAQEARGRVNTMLKNLEVVNALMTQQLQEAAEVSRGIRDSVSLSVTALQFDDMVNQLVQHIAGRLQRLEPLATQLLAGDTDAMAVALESHQVLSAGAQHKSVAQLSMQNGDVELF